MEPGTVSASEATDPVVSVTTAREVTACPLCRVPTPMETTRCSTCGYHLAGVDGRAGPLADATIRWLVAALVAVYLVTLMVVLVAR